MRRRRRNEPDNRLDWRDPDMWVLRKVYITDRFGIEKVQDEYVYHEEVQAQAQDNMRELRNPHTPDWRKDPTYDLAKGKRTRR